MLGSDYDQGPDLLLPRRRLRHSAVPSLPRTSPRQCQLCFTSTTPRLPTPASFSPPVSINYAQLIVEAAAARASRARSSAATRSTATWSLRPPRARMSMLRSRPSIRRVVIPSSTPASRSGSMPTPTPRPTTAATTWSPPSPSWATTLTSPRSGHQGRRQHRPADILAALPGVTYSGISGEISFDDIGDATRRGLHQDRQHRDRCVGLREDPGHRLRKSPQISPQAANLAGLSPRQVFPVFPLSSDILPTGGFPCREFYRI